MGETVNINVVISREANRIIKKYQAENDISRKGTALDMFIREMGNR